MLNSFEESQSCSIHKSCNDSSAIKGAYRYLDNVKISESLLISNLQEQCFTSVLNREILALCDTTTFNFTNHSGRLRDTSGLGPIGNVNGFRPLGFVMHPILIQDSKSGMPLGISDVKLWARSFTKQREKSKRYATKDICIEEKESYKWLEPCERSKKGSLSQASHVTFVMDREGDIMEVYDRLPDDHTDVLVRVMHNRNVINEQGNKERLYDYIDTLPCKGTSTITVKTKTRKPRNAKVSIKYGECTLLWHNRQKVTYKNNPNGVVVSVVEIKEKQHRGYKNEPALIWRLITSRKVSSLKQAKKQIDQYEQRWKIEEYFKFLKSDGYDVEKTELTKGTSIRKLVLIIMKASIKVLQLKAARDGKTQKKISSIFTEDEIFCLQKLNQEYEGNTEKQRNPYDPTNLAWASWVIARLGGWKEFYDKSRPPGNKTFAWGLEKFESIMYAFDILKNKDVS